MRKSMFIGRIAAGCALAVLLVGAAFGADETATAPFAFRLDTITDLTATAGETRELALSPDGIDRRATVGYSITGAGVADTVLKTESTCGQTATLGLLSSGTYVFTYDAEGLTLEETVKVSQPATPVKEGLDTLSSHVVQLAKTGAAPVQPLSFSACDWGLGDGRAVQLTVAREDAPAETLATFFAGEEGWLPWTPTRSGTYLVTHRTADAVETAEFTVRADYAGGADNPWDISSGGDGSLLAYLEDGALYITGAGRTKDYSLPSSVPWATSFADISSVIVDDGVKLGANVLSGLKGEEHKGVRIVQSLNDLSTMTTGSVMSAGMTSFTIDPVTKKADIGLEVMASVSLTNAEWMAVTNFEVEVSAEGPQGFYRLDIKPGSSEMQ